jgi:hypothetical protein
LSPVVLAIDYPRETQYRALRRNDLLTRAFTNPQTLVDEADYFLHHQGLQVGLMQCRKPPARVRHVLFVTYEPDRKLLLYPLVLILCATTILSGIIALRTRDLATGAQVGGAIGGGAALGLAYAMWRLS